MSDARMIYHVLWVFMFANVSNRKRVTCNNREPLVELFNPLMTNKTFHFIVFLFIKKGFFVISSGSILFLPLS